MAKTICFVAMLGLLFSILGCSKEEKEAQQEEQLDSKTEVSTQDLTQPKSKELTVENKTGAKPAKQETRTPSFIQTRLNSYVPLFTGR